MTQAGPETDDLGPFFIFFLGLVFGLLLFFAFGPVVFAAAFLTWHDITGGGWAFWIALAWGVIFYAAIAGYFLFLAVAFGSDAWKDRRRTWPKTLVFVAGVVGFQAFIYTLIFTRG